MSKEKSTAAITFHLVSAKGLGLYVKRSTTESKPLDESKSAIAPKIYASFEANKFSPTYSFDGDCVPLLPEEKSEQRKENEEAQKQQKTRAIVDKLFRVTLAEQKALGAALREQAGGENDNARYILDAFFKPSLFRWCSLTTVRGDCQIFKTAGEKKPEKFFVILEDDEIGFHSQNFLLRPAFSEIKPDAFIGLRSTSQYGVLGEQLKKAMDSVNSKLSWTLHMSSLFIEVKLKGNPASFNEAYWYSLSYAGLTACIISAGLALSWKQQTQSEKWFAFPVVIGVVAGEITSFRKVTIVPCASGKFEILGAKMKISVQHFDLDPVLKLKTEGVGYTNKHAFKLDVDKREELLARFVLPMYYSVLKNYHTVAQWFAPAKRATSSSQSSEIFEFEGIPADDLPTIPQLEVATFTRLNEGKRSEVFRVTQGNKEFIRKTFADNEYFLAELEFLLEFYKAVVLNKNEQELAITLARLTCIKEVKVTSIKQLCDIALEYAREVKRFHDKYWTHLDIKPSNMYTDGKNYQILDGEFANCGGEIVGGSPLYAAPELEIYLEETEEQQDKPEGKKCDIYSLGLSLVCLLKPSSSPKETLEDNLKQLKAEHQQLGALLEDMTATDPYDRPSIDSVVEELLAITTTSKLAVGSSNTDP